MRGEKQKDYMGSSKETNQMSNQEPKTLWPLSGDRDEGEEGRVSNHTQCLLRACSMPKCKPGIKDGLSLSTTPGSEAGQVLPAIPTAPMIPCEVG